MIAHLYPLPGNEDFTAGLCRQLDVPGGLLSVHRFPDAEVRVRFDTKPTSRIALVCTRPGDQVLPLLFAAHAARMQGATQIGLVAPYLSYLRQDRVFNPGEGLSSRAFGELLSGAFDWLVTVDPHLHRYASLDEVYRIPSRVASASPAVARWIRQHVREPLLIGPDAESEQWVSAIAAAAEAPYLTLSKQRLGDRSVHLSLPDLRGAAGRTPVLVDDIISSGGTACRALQLLRQAPLAPPVCIATHAVFSDSAHADLLAAGAERIVTTDTIHHVTNAVSVVPAVADAVRHVAVVTDRTGGSA